MSLPKLPVIVSCVVLCSADGARAATIVPGSANPNLAGRAIGYQCCSGDSTPTQSPPGVAALEIEDCAHLSIAATGKVSFDGGVPAGNNPDGDAGFSMTNFGDGISAPKAVRANALVGVFLTDDSPTGAATPAQLDFELGIDFQDLFPEIGQIFFIGDGRTSDTQIGDFSGPEQDFRVPRGASRLFLGTADGVGWFNNTGSFLVDVTMEPDDAERECGDPVDPLGVASSDALYVLRGAVGAVPCPFCVCDADHSGGVFSSDALRVLRHAVGQKVPLLCECCPHLD